MQTPGAAEQIRWVTLAELLLRYGAYQLRVTLHPSEALTARLAIYRKLIKWYAGLNPTRFVREGVEVDVGVPPLLEAALPSPSTR